MIWVLRRLVGPAALAGIACLAILVTWVSVEDGELHLTGLRSEVLLIFPLQLAGVALFLLPALALSRAPLPASLFPLLVIVTGALIEGAVATALFGLSDIEIAIPAILGAIGGAAWVALNRDVRPLSR